VCVWRVADGVCVARFYCRTASQWAPQWTDDEARMAWRVTNEVHLYDGRDIAKGVQQRVRLEGATVLWTAPGPGPHKFAAFTPEKKVQCAQRPCTHPHSYTL
jgi:uncharacterized protein with WD repeat